MSAKVTEPFEPVFKAREVALAALLAFLVEGGILLIWIYAGAGSAHVNAAPIEVPKEIPINVKPVMDELPLLKLGGKKKAKLPDMWKKQARCSASKSRARLPPKPTRRPPRCRRPSSRPSTLRRLRPTPKPPSRWISS